MSYFCLKAQRLGRQHKIATQDVAVRFKHAHRCACCGLRSAKQIYSLGRVGMAVPYICRKAQTSRRQQKVANSRCSSVLQTCAQARILRLAQCKADLIMRGRNDSAIPMCEGTNIKTPAEGLQTQDVAVRVKIVHSCAYSSAQDVPPPKAE